MRSSAASKCSDLRPPGVAPAARARRANAQRAFRGSRLRKVAGATDRAGEEDGHEVRQLDRLQADCGPRRGPLRRDDVAAKGRCVVACARDDVGVGRGRRVEGPRRLARACAHVCEVLGEASPVGAERAGAVAAARQPARHAAVRGRPVDADPFEESSTSLSTVCESWARSTEMTAPMPSDQTQSSRPSTCCATSSMAAACRCAACLRSTRRLRVPQSESRSRAVARASGDADSHPRSSSATSGSRRSCRTAVPQSACRHSTE
ncbi:hypothetical protein M885DRAFT_538438 [Pelagophyceae sp. CCMP2097]|nr:hypothetical protein M885DRAFT_538438 [Pelagophyceae sp. CCMP2097]